MIALNCLRRYLLRTTWQFAVLANLTGHLYMPAKAADVTGKPTRHIDPTTALQKPSPMKPLEHITVLLRPAKPEGKVVDARVIVFGPEGKVALPSTKALLNYLKIVRNSRYLRNKELIVIRADVGVELDSVFDAGQACRHAGFERIALR